MTYLIIYIQEGENILEQRKKKKVLVKDIIFTVQWTVFTTKTFIFDFIVI